MNMPAYELYYGSDDYRRRKKNMEREPVSLSPRRLDAVKSEFAVSVLTKDQIRKINRRYKLTDLTCKKMKFCSGLIEMDVLTEVDGCSIQNPEAMYWNR